MSAAFTPGPWGIDRKQDYGALRGIRVKEVARNFVVAVVVADTHELWLDREGNARLIASAPEMFAALDTIVRTADQQLVNSLGDVWTAAVDALSKASGRSA